MYSSSKTIHAMLRAEAQAKAEYDRWLMVNGLVRKGSKKKTRGTPKSAKKPYRVHLVWDLCSRKGKKKSTWVPLGHYTTIMGAYARVNELRAHHMKQRRERPNLDNMRTPTFFIEIKSKRPGAPPMVRAFDLQVEATIDMFTTNPLSAFAPYQGYTYPKMCALMPSDKVKGKN